MCQLRHLFTFFLLTLAAACGGGGISGSGGLPPGDSIGRIDGFGSVILNGTTFNTDSATFVSDDQVVTQADLRVGQVVRVRGDFEGQIADTVVYSSEVKGPVNSVTILDAALGSATMVVMGQTVRLNSQTIYEDTSLELIAPGDLLEVSGLRDETGVIVATYVDDKAALPEYKVVGTLANVDVLNRTFEVGLLTVDYLTADTSDMPGTPATWNGLRVEVKGLAGDYDSVAQTLIATDVEPDVGANVTAGVPLEIEGYISNFVSTLQFQVQGIPVRTTPATVYQDGTVLSLANGVKVEVEGTVAADGALVATRIEYQSTGAIRGEGALEAVDAGAGTLTLFGLTWEVRAETELEDDSAAGVDPLTLLDLTPGDRIEVRGYLDGDQIVASRVERADADTDARLRGPVTSLANVGSGEIEILGVGVDFDVMTLTFDTADLLIPQGTFLSALSVGTFVDAKWDPYLGAGLPADELSLEDD